MKDLQFPINDSHYKHYASEFYNKELEIYQKILEKYQSPTFFDVGSNIGYYACTLASDCKDVHAFEPVSVLYEFLEQNSVNLNNVTCNKLALGECEKTVEIQISEKHNQGSSIDSRIKTKFKNIFGNKSETIAVNTLVNYCQESDIDRIHLLKLDVEGYEFNVIRGTGQFLDNIDNIIFESYFPKDVEDIRNYTKQYGFSLDKLDLQTGGPMYILKRGDQ